ncbi:NRT1 PTR FAMILY -like, partial [Olea europaea subsp. europaea]
MLITFFLDCYGSRGLCFLSTSVVLYSFKSSHCQNATNNKACSAPQFQIIIFYFSLYLVALAQGGHKPCVQAFGADQFDEHDLRESEAKSSFFNWWYFSMNLGTIMALLVLCYIQDNLSWGLGFGIPCIVMCLALITFLLGTRTYRFRVRSDERNPFVRIGRVFLNATRNWRTTQTAISKGEEARGILPYQSSEQFKFLNKALLAPDGSKEYGKVCTVTEIEEAKAVLRLVPIWTTYVFTMVGLQEFFYDQVQNELKSIGLALYLSIFGIGNFSSSFLISVVGKTTSGP